MVRIRIQLILMILLFLFSSCKNSKPVNLSGPELIKAYTKETSSMERQDFDQLTILLVPKILSASPLYASFKYENLEELGLESLNSKLDNMSIQAMEEHYILAQETLDSLGDIDYDLLSSQQKIIYDLLVFQNQLAIQLKPYEFYTPMIEPSSGLQISILLNLMQLEFQDENDLSDYLLRLKALPSFIEQIIEYEDTRKTMGLLLPSSLYELVLDQLDALRTSPDEFIVYEDFCDALTTINTLSDSQKDSYKNKCLEIIENDIYPAYDSLYLSIENLITENAQSGNLCSYPNGKDYYNYLLFKETSYHYNGDTFHTFIENEIKRILSEIQVIYASHPEFLTMNIGENLPTYGSLDELYAIQETCLHEQFYDYGISPAQSYTIPDFLSNYLAAGFYFPVTIDGEGYGNMYLNQSDFTNPDTSTLELLFHEDLPGHHLYFSQFYQCNAPLIQKLSSWLPYEEGWAQYIQNVSIEYFGQSKELTSLLKLVSQLSMFQMMLSDLEYHYMGYSQEQILESYIRFGYSENGAQKAINRMIAHPGEVIHYVFGAYKIEGYKKLCIEKLGNSFQIKDFHDLILRNGGIPFSTMDTIINEYIQSNKQ